MNSEVRQGISLCMIVRDEEHCIETVLSTTRPYVDEIIVVDTGSLDRTIEISRKYADVLEHFEWINDFSAARNHSLSFASKPWILVLDADEVIAPQDFEPLGALTTREDVDGYTLTQRLYQDNTGGEDALWRPVSDYQEFAKGYRGYRENRIFRLFRNDPSIRYANKIHEIVDHSIQTDRTDDSGIPIHHHHEKTANDFERHIRRDLEILESVINSGEATAREYLTAGAGHTRVTKDYSKAIEYLSRAMELGADASKTLEGLAEALYRAGRYVDAASLYEKLYEEKLGSGAVLNNLSNLRARLGDLNGAIALLEELLGQGVSDPVRRQRIEQNVVALKQALANSNS